MATAIHCGSANYAVKMLEKGFNLVTVSSDVLAMVQGLQAEMKIMKNFLNDTKKDDDIAGGY